MISISIHSGDASPIGEKIVYPTWWTNFIHAHQRPARLGVRSWIDSVKSELKKQHNAIWNLENIEFATEEDLTLFLLRWS